MRRKHTVFVPATIVPLGTLTSYFSPNPLYAPLVTPLEFKFVGALGAAPVYPLMVTRGLPPANESVVPMRRVAAPVCEEVAVNLIVRGELTDLKRAIGKLEAEEAPTVYVVEEEDVQEDMRASEGCMRSWEAACRKPVGLIWRVRC